MIPEKRSINGELILAAMVICSVFVIEESVGREIDDMVGTDKEKWGEESR